MSKEEVAKLLERYRDGLCTEAEKALVESWHLRELSNKNSDIDHAELKDARKKIWNAIKEETQINSGRKYKLWLNIAAAAVVLFFIGYAIQYKYQNQFSVGQKTVETQVKEILPGGNKATLTLADGSKISLTDASNGVIAKQAGINITKTNNGELIYTVASVSNTKKNLYNTIETPRGGQYQINLPDGTKVWLNAESSLKYPAAFDDVKRTVELKGEAYFEVAKRTNKNGRRLPFSVKTELTNGRNQEVEVLGTHFNVNAYNNEPSNKTTLLEGSVRIKNLRSNITGLLKPGQQSIINSSAGVQIAAVDVAESVAWKDGFFSFNEENLETIMNKISRWYDVEIDYQGNKINKTFGGRISRFNSVNEVLDMLQTTEAVHFKIDGRRILVMP